MASGASPERKQPIAVTIVAHDIGPIGGMERQLTNLTAGLLDRGHQVTVVARSCDLPAHQSLEVKRVRVPSRPFVLGYPLFAVIATFKVLRHKRGLLHTTGAVVFNKADVITVHLCHRAIARIPALIRSRRQNVLWRTHGRISAWMARAGEAWCYRRGRVRRIVAVSRGGLEELNEVFPSLRGLALSIPNGVQIENVRQAVHDFQRTMPAAQRKRDLVALFVGGEWEGKGLRHAITALATAPGWTLLVVGEGDTRRYSALADECGVRDRVQFCGWREDVFDIYARADAFVLPSSYETFSLAAFEAATAGLPLLVTRVRGVTELVEDGVTGWYIEPDGVDIGRHLVELADAARRNAIGQAASAAARRFSIDSMVDRYAELYAELQAG